ncbi:hypothetical protein APHNP_0019 [Anaplasma phagocytophilum str. ApNP]|uniref:Uncharacterized protein n=1 Tax=Anaplasma phagocytophilum str. ApNP TaxID=1359153 RepID=A0A0F3NFU4_ANAPH|nr:hypothetical protein APHNP_1834 [Anaplasma phagocytophilum str. ApNP]KJV66552.1 hypothetical protein APHNP_0019 [Anaplasma phagocytophilum str. ApNP]
MKDIIKEKSVFYLLKGLSFAYKLQSIPQDSVVDKSLFRYV